MSKLKFMDACMSGDAMADEIENYIEEWHESDSEETIYDFLGMTEEEYGLWVENESILKSIFFARKTGISISDFIGRDAGRTLVARSSSPEEAAFVQRWLVRTGRVEK
ncbi:hypothetical protein [Paenibacillus naphthalenovorans]|uniref:hypothetical protein n=1 Tax=Paenibacillus naphthalenovorans TaxID=162209 RepID=UPI003D29B021